MKIALTLPGTSPIPTILGLKPEFVDLASLLTPILNIAFYIAVFATFYFMVWGAFQYMMALGKKEDLAKARARITWAIIGLMVVFLSYFIAKFGAEIFTPKGGVPF